MVKRDMGSLRAYLDRITRPQGGIETLAQQTEEQVAEETAAPGQRAGAEGAWSGERADAGRKANPAAEVAGRVLADAALSAAEKLRTGSGELDRAELAATEALIIPDKRPAFDVVKGDFLVNHRLWTHLADGKIHSRLTAAIPAIGRIELPGQERIPFGGTGFIVGEGLVMTNRHVAAIFAQGSGARGLSFRFGWSAGLDLRRERGQPVGPVLEVRQVRMIHPYWDMALLEVSGLPRDVEPLSLSAQDAREEGQDREIAVIGYPAYDPLRNDPDIQNALFDRVYGVKRLQPGMLAGPRDTGSFGRLVRTLGHDCSTLGGNSGSGLIDLGTGLVVGLHFGGLYQEINHAVPSSELARDSRVRDAGVQVEGLTAGDPPAEVLRAWADAEAGAKEASDPGVPAGSATTTAGQATSAAQAGSAGQAASGRLTFEVPLRITVELAAAAGAAAPVVVVEPQRELTEAMVEPVRDRDYSGRGGYDEAFLAHGRRDDDRLLAPMPRPADEQVLARLRTGGDVLEYEHFSIMMHAGRRLALVTAANVTMEPALRRPEPGRSYTRRDLGGLGKNDREKWFIDPRLDERWQLSDIFFTRDGGAFDKGHLVRREDVAWGRSYAEVQRANGDTYHVTNCSPQVLPFNQSSRGEDNWGDLENLVLAQARDQRLCVLSGPVLAESDETFVGVSEGRALLRVKIPSRYWKVIVARQGKGMAAFGFVLEQDLSAVELEFAAPENFRRLQVPLSVIGEAAGLIFDDGLLGVDAFDSDVGIESAWRGGLVRTDNLAVAPHGRK